MQLHNLLMVLISSVGIFVFGLGPIVLYKKQSVWLALSCFVIGIGANIQAWTSLGVLALPSSVGAVVTAVGLLLLWGFIFVRFLHMRTAKPQ